MWIVTNCGRVTNEFSSQIKAEAAYPAPVLRMISGTFLSHFLFSIHFPSPVSFLSLFISLSLSSLKTLLRILFLSDCFPSSSNNGVAALAAFQKSQVYSFALADILAIGCLINEGEVIDTLDYTAVLQLKY